MQNKTWTQRDGTVIAIADMTDTHLANTIAMLERIAIRIHQAEMDACASISFMGEMAQYEQDNFLAHSEWEDYLPNIYNDLCREVLKRKLDNIK